MFCPLPQGHTACDTLRQWQRTYSRELDHETRQECAATERVLRKAAAAAGGGEALLRRPRRFRHSLPFFETSITTLRSLRHLSLCDTVAAAPAPAKPFDALQDSQLFDAENSEPLLSSEGGRSPGQDWPWNNRISEVGAAPGSPKRRQRNGSAQRHGARGTEAAVLYGVTILFMH